MTGNTGLLLIVKISEWGTNGIPQGSILGPILFITLHQQPRGSGTTSDAGKFVDGTKIGRSIRSDEDAGLLQEDLSKLLT